MWHKKRMWSVTSVGSPDDLAEKLTQWTWTGCTAFELAGYLFANDATSANGAQEYGVLKPDQQGRDLIQIESITFSWCTEIRALDLIQRILNREFETTAYGHVSRSRFQTTAEHGFCPLCR